MAIQIEEEFGVRIDERVYEKCATVGELAEYLEEHWFPRSSRVRRPR
ncbi:phosphopantetheine-binding protein [Corynebacterium sp. P3-F1]|nr:phosphopantetheine-binding protein [Corynebacterium sp. P3-F1]WKK62312.1 phosphopantetheine-binding protein [Corynebacterium sp. P3-F1]